MLLSSGLAPLCVQKMDGRVEKVFEGELTNEVFVLGQNGLSILSIIEDQLLVSKERYFETESVSKIMRLKDNIYLVQCREGRDQQWRVWIRDRKTPKNSRLLDIIAISDDKVSKMQIFKMKGFDQEGYLRLNIAMNHEGKLALMEVLIDEIGCRLMTKKYCLPLEVDVQQVEANLKGEIIIHGISSKKDGYHSNSGLNTYKFEL